jgi:hypothetical protein
MTPAPVHYLGLMVFWLAGDEQSELAQRLNLRTQQRAVLNQTYHLRRGAAQIAQAGRASDLYRLLAPASDEARGRKSSASSATCGIWHR